MPTFNDIILQLKENAVTDTHHPIKGVGTLYVKGKPLSGLAWRCASLNGTTNTLGEFQYDTQEPITFLLEGYTVATAQQGSDKIHLEQLDSPFADTDKHYLSQFFIDADQNKGQQAYIQAPTCHDALEVHYFKHYQTLLPHAYEQRCFGINLAAPQAEVDNIHQPQPFVDIFRTARPFAEYSDEGIIYDSYGWPIFIPKGKKATTLLLQHLPLGAVPMGHYNVIYDGEGSIQYGGFATLVMEKKQHGEFDVIALDPLLLKKINRIIINITATNPQNPLRNIRVVMPGGFCKGNPFNRVESCDQCSNDGYQSFAEILKKDRNSILFNPDYLRFFRHFDTLRMMNFMETSPRAPQSNATNPCADKQGQPYTDCLLQERHWNQRAKLNDATWGGSYKTIVTQRYGVPLEVTVYLANLLNANPWYIIPHNASDDYIKQFALYVKQNLAPHLIAHIEYTNEFWNNFWGSLYVQEQGKQLGLDQPILPFRNAEYTAKVRYYSKRSVEVFAIWESVMGGTNRIKRILGSYISSHVTSQNVLEYNNAFQHCDAIAIAPYFHGAWSRTVYQHGESKPHPRCSNRHAVPKVFAEAQCVDDIFDIIAQPFDNAADIAEADKGDPYALDSIIQMIKKHAQIAKDFDVDLVAYEGGQHLVTHWGDKCLEETTKKHIQHHFENANRDQRMGILYSALFAAWKEAGGTLFTVFTAPQSFNRYGVFGIKEHLNKRRDQSPKFDALMQFQEKEKKPWW